MYICLYKKYINANTNKGINKYSAYVTGKTVNIIKIMLVTVCLSKDGKVTV